MERSKYIVVYNVYIYQLIRNIDRTIIKEYNLNFVFICTCLVIEIMDVCLSNLVLQAQFHDVK